MTRREVLRSALLAGLVVPEVRRPAILAEPHLLSEESGKHFQQMWDGCKVVGDWIVLPGTREMSAARAVKLRSRAERGAWVILESGLCFATELRRQQQTRLWENAFGLSFADSPKVSDLFIEYGWPLRQIVRGFGVCTLLESAAGAIAQSGGKPVCCRRVIGRGGIIFLGSMLGPGLGAGEREAERIGMRLIEAIARETS